MLFRSIGFTSYTYDVVLDKFFAQARFYDASNRRFLSIDPIKDGTNWYAYVGNSPLVWIDPTGLAACYSKTDEWYRRFLSGYEQGFVDYYGARWDEISAVLDDPLGSYLEMMKQGFSDPFKASLAYKLPVSVFNQWESLITNFYVPLVKGDFYAVGKFIGEIHARALEALVVAAIVKGVEVGVAKIGEALASRGVGVKIKTNLGNEIDITPSSNHSATTKNPGLKGAPNSSVDILDSAGNIKTRRWFGSDGLQMRDVDFTNHNNIKQHPEWPHEHGVRK